MARLGAAGSAAAAGAPLPPPLGFAAPCGGRPPAPAFGWGLSGFFASAMVLSLVDDLARLAGDPNLLAVGQRPHADASRSVARRIGKHDIGEMNGALAFDDPTLAKLLRRPLVLLDHVDALDHDAALLGNHAQDAAAFSAILACHHDHGVTLAPVWRRHWACKMTSGANEMILVNCLSRSSRATGPKMRVPTGLSSAFNSTTALRSNRM